MHPQASRVRLRRSWSPITESLLVTTECWLDFPKPMTQRCECAIWHRICTCRRRALRAASMDWCDETWSSESPRPRIDASCLQCSQPRVAPSSSRSHRCMSMAYVGTSSAIFLARNCVTCPVPSDRSRADFGQSTVETEGTSLSPVNYSNFEPIFLRMLTSSGGVPGGASPGV